MDIERDGTAIATPPAIAVRPSAGGGGMSDPRRRVEIMSSRAGYRIGKVEPIVRAEGPDKIALFAIRPARADIGGYGGSSPREVTACVR
jgi:hypothetical protein